MKPVIIFILAVCTMASCTGGNQHRSPAMRRAFEHSHPCPATGKTSGACPGYVADHVIPLACGGPDDPSNMMWQSVAEGKKKDRWERKDCNATRKYAEGRKNE